MSYIAFESFAEILENSVSRYNDRILFETYDQKWDYHIFYRDVLCFAEVLSTFTHRYVKISIEHPYNFSVVCFATFITGKTAVLSEVKHAEADVLFIDDAFFGKHLKTEAAPNLNLKELDADHPCVIIQSSGTTSVSKGVMLSQKNLITELHMLIQFKPFPEHEVYYHLLPYTHLFGLLGEFLIPFCTGGKICFADNNINLFHNFAVFKPTYLCIPPAIVDSIAKVLQATRNYAFATGGKLKAIISGGAFLHEKTRNILISNGVQVYIAYGLTECSPVISIERDGNTLCDSVGQILPCCKVKIEDGEIVVSGDTVMLGYWNDSSATEAVLIDGWLHTGDIGYIDDNGYLFLTGRISNLIVFENGEKLIPESLENEINCIPEVIESLVLSKRIGQNKSKIVIEILIYPKEYVVSDFLSLKVKNIANRFISDGLLNSIRFLSKPLQRNSIGKIDRKSYMLRIDDNSDMD
ncbi:MAG: AMP-binding protein [Acutalibacteraceae bacterium]|nr:AMP-binding protein [Acutalibacteraceae bacterium]